MFQKLFSNNKYIILSVIAIFVLAKFSYAVDYNKYGKARIQILNKITGKSNVYDIPVNTIFNFDTRLSLIVKVCYKATQRYTPEDVMFLQVAKASDGSDSQVALLNNTKVLNNPQSYIDSLKQRMNSDSNTSDKNSLENKHIGINFKQGGASSSLIFSGWIFSNHPELSTLTDPTYDISIVKCLN